MPITSQRLLSSIDTLESPGGLMSRFAPRPLFAFALVLLLSLPVIPATAKRPEDLRGGKRALGTVASFDPSTMALTLASHDGSHTTTATVSDHVKIKVEHRGDHTRGPGHGNPSRGSLDDLVPGAFVLTVHTRDELITYIRLRPAKHPGPAHDEAPDQGLDEPPAPRPDA
jgi:hypothetical protein